MRESGKTAAAFDESQYAVSEDKSPNVHTRQVRTIQSIQVDWLQVNVSASFSNSPYKLICMHCRRRAFVKVLIEVIGSEAFSYRMYQDVCVKDQGPQQRADNAIKVVMRS